MYVCLRVLKKCRFLLLLLSFLYCSFSLCSISGSVSLCLSISHPHIPAHTCAHENSQFKAGFLFIYLFTCLPSHLLFLTLFSKRTDETVCVRVRVCVGLSACCTGVRSKSGFGLSLSFSLCLWLRERHAVIKTRT